MKNLVNYLLISTLMLISGTALADDVSYHARVRLQGSSAQPGGLGVSGVVESPDLPSAPGMVLSAVGLGVKEEKIDLGIHVGTLMVSGEAEIVLDLRSSFSLTDHIGGWGNVRWNDMSNADVSSLYGFMMLDYKLPFKAPISVGVETENVVFAGNTEKKDFSVGPNILLGLSGDTRIELSYQMHSNDAVENQFWARLNVKL